MPLSPEQLGLRWQTQRGHDLRNEIRVALEAGRQDWEQLFEGFEGVDEVPNHRDLRHIPLDGLGAEEADLSSADLAGARLVRGRFKGANQVLIFGGRILGLHSRLPSTLNRRNSQERCWSSPS